jgi:hypothetical protein
MVCTTHEGHQHKHGASCGHKAVEHEGHIDYLHDGHLHHVHDGHVDEHQMSAGTNPEACTPLHQCGSHKPEHQHGTACGHEAVPHGDHTDYVVAGHLHHPCGAHCDDHGKVQLK